MTRTFIQTHEFAKNWVRLGLTDDDLRRLELEILKNPRAGKVIEGTGSLITVYPKNEKDNLSKAECNNIKKLIGILERNL